MIRKTMLMCWLLVTGPAIAADYPAQPAIGGGLVCLSDSGVTCFAAASMTEQWSALPGRYTFEPVVAPPIIVVGSTTGLHALDIATGARRWRWPGGGEVFSPAVSSGTAYVTDRAGRVAAIELLSGDVKWQRRLEGWLYAPALVGDLAVTGGRAGVLHALDRESGQTVWTRPLDQELVYRPVAVEDGVVVTTFKGTVTRLTRGGDVRWQARDPSPSFSPTVAGDLLIFGGMDGHLRARHAATGKLRWTVVLSGPLSRPARVHKGEVAVVSRDGDLVVMAADDGAVLDRRSMPGTPLGGAIPGDNGNWRAFYKDSGTIALLEASME